MSDRKHEFRPHTKDLDLSSYQVRTDLAIEAHEMAIEKQAKQARQQEEGIPGVRVDDFEENGIEVIKVHIENEQAAKRVGKKPGRYLTLEARGLRENDSEYQDKVATLLANQFHQFLQEAGIGIHSRCLIVGLGNWNVTPDALGPEVVKRTMVTNHLFNLRPEEVEDGFRSVSAVTPGVMGVTGLETSEIVQGIVEKTQPDFIIAIDALAARSVERLNTTIQISDTGIAPGSGVGNKRQGINEETLGVPVIAVGVPTVVDAVSIVSDSMDFLLGHVGKRMQEEEEGSNARRSLVPSGMSFAFQEPEKFDPDTIPDEDGRKAIMGMVGGLGEQEKRQLIAEVLQPLGQHLIVTPKEVDDFIEDIGNVIANGLNAALHEKIDMSNVSAYIH